jgi:hypothetical protein
MVMAGLFPVEARAFSAGNITNPSRVYAIPVEIYSLPGMGSQGAGNPRAGPDA